MEELVADEFRFTSPLDNAINRATFFKRCWPSGADITQHDLERVVADGGTVFVTYNLTMKGDAFRNTEVLKIDGGKVRAAEVYFGWDLPHKAEPGGFIDKEES